VGDDSGRTELWRTALQDAAGVFAAYFTPPEYGLTALAVRANESDPDALFATEIRRRLDLGRAIRFAEMLSSIKVSSAYRHRIFYRNDRIDGQIHVPRLLIARAMNPDAPVPVLRATRQPITPENLFVSEALNRTAVICRSWQRNAFGTSGSSAEQVLATSVLGSLGKFESRKPWNDLKFRPRPSFRALSDSVEHRLKAGMIPSDPLSEIVKLFATEHTAPTAFECSASLMALPITENPQFEDRLFELLCLAWILDAVSPRLTGATVWPMNLKAAGGKPLLEGRTTAGERLRIYYQTGTALPEPQWTYVPSDPSKKLRGIIDILIELGEGESRRLLLVDAKNRRQSESEVFYKMLGYQQNFQIPIYNAIAIFPAEDDSTRLKCLSNGEHRVWMARLPLASGRPLTRSVVTAVVKTL
jgi:hypothetical protein